MSSQNPVFISKPLLPDLTQLNELLSNIWESRIVTNEGPYHGQLESELKAFMQVPNARLFANGTAALMCALYALKLPEGAEVITTPLTFGATAHSIAACGYKPVFADIDPGTLTLDPEAVKRAITDRTRAVMAVHTYGTICDVDGLRDVCNVHGLPLIFDAAHAFGSSLGDLPVGLMGDINVFSTHATKLYNTLEGGIATTADDDLDKQLKLARNFGIVDEENVTEIGINGKMSEVHAAVGLLNLPLVENERRQRRQLRAKYNTILAGQPGLRAQVRQPDVIHSEQYYPMLIDPAVFGRTRDDIYTALKARGVNARKYFWPICTDFTPYKDHKIHATRNVPVAEQVKDKVLCLPFHSSVDAEHIDIITEVLRGKIGTASINAAVAESG